MNAPNDWLEQNKGVRPLNLTLMAMHNPPHSGEFIIQVCLDPNNLSGRELAGKLGVAASTLNRILTGTSRISPEMALRLSKALGRFPEGLG
jgi:addiction module HigA family antidote